MLQNPFHSNGPPCGRARRPTQDSQPVDEAWTSAHDVTHILCLDYLLFPPYNACVSGQIWQFLQPQNLLRINLGISQPGLTRKGSRSLTFNNVPHSPSGRRAMPPTHLSQVVPLVISTPDQA